MTLREFRQSLGLTCQEFANSVGLKNRTSIEKYERGDNLPNRTTIRSIINKYGNAIDFNASFLPVNKGTKRKNRQLEYILHCQIAHFLKLVLPEDKVWWTSIEVSNNDGSELGRRRQARNRRKGVKAGVPDIFIAYNSNILWMEVKIPGNDLSLSQIEVHKRLKAQGHFVEIVRSLEDVIRILKEYKAPGNRGF
jgi:transcriptional regulator with XRE-family HTH domain